jgi:uncharacterized membrane protein YdjX (TVP38/TMEM64 family)
MGHAIAIRAQLAVRHPATLVAAVLAAAFGVAVLVHPSTWATFTAMAGGDKETLRDMILGFGTFAPLASIALNVAQAIVAPIPGFVVPFVNGAVFGTWWGMIITWVGGIAAASACFWIARTVGRRFAERICSQFSIADDINRRLERHAFIAIFLGRLVPGVPFDFLSYFVGLTRVRFWTFTIATALGSVPHAFLYAFMGSSLEIPLWMGVLMTPALGLVYAGVKLAITALRTGRDATDIHVIAVEPGPVDAPSAGESLATWTAAPAGSSCGRDGRAVPLTAWTTRRRVTTGPAPSCSPA